MLRSVRIGVGTLFVCSVFAPNAAAEHVLFTFDTLQMQNALIQTLNNEFSPLVYAFFDVSMRPAIIDVDNVAHPIRNYSLVNAISPAPFTTNVDEWQATFVDAGGFRWVDFKWKSTDSIASLVTDNPLNGQKIAGDPFGNKRMYQMTSSRTWSILIDAPITIDSQVTWLIDAKGVKFKDASAERYQNRSVSSTGYVDFYGEVQAPEPAGLALAGTGLALIVWAAKRRRPHG